MPGSNTGHLPQTLVSLPGELLCVPAACHAYQPTEQNAMTLGDTNDINHLVLVEDSRYGHGLLQTLLCPVHLVRDAASIYKILVQLFLSCLILPLLTVLGEGLLLQLHAPVFVESALALVTDMLSKDGFERTLAIHTEASAVHLPEGVGHACLVSQEGGKVDRLAGVVFGPCTHPPPVLLATFVGQKPHVPVAGCVEFAMRLQRTLSQTESKFTSRKLRQP
uniref:Uncharacterized protein n=1 Tax=Lates calcarifer TaxID=8187 RepID=A0A4W6DTY8_LATCA